jgi:hypothetical protein
MKHLKSYEQFNINDLEQIDEGMFSTTWYDILKEYGNGGKQYDDKLKNKIAATTLYVDDFKKLLVSNKVDQSIIKTLDKYIDGQKKLRIVGLSTTKIDEILKKWKSMSKEQVNNEIFYNYKSTLKTIPDAKKWNEIANELIKLNKEDSVKNYSVTISNDGQLVIGGVTPMGAFAGGAGVGGGGAAQIAKKKPVQKPVQTQRPQSQA